MSPKRAPETAARDLGCSGSAAWNAHAHGARLDLDLERLDLGPVAAVELVEHLAVQLDLDRVGLRRLHERRFGRRADRRAGDRAGPLDEALGGHDTQLEHPVVGSRTLERLDSGEEVADVAEQDAARLALVPADAVDLDLGVERLQAQVLRSAPDVGDASDPVLESARVPDHRGVETGSGHHREPLAVEAADVEATAFATEPERDCLLDVLRDPEIRGEEVRGAGGDDREAHVRPGEHVDASLNHPVAAPRKHELGTLVQGPLNLSRRLPALRHLGPERLGDSLGFEQTTKLEQPAPSVLPEWATTATFTGPRRLA